MIVNWIKVVKHLLDDGQGNLIPHYFVVLVPAAHDLPNCIIMTFSSYESACDYLANIAEKITKCNENYVFHREDYPTPLDDLVK